MNYRKKPVVIQATQWFKDGDHPAVIRKTAPNRHADEGIPWVPTLEGGHVVTPGDWIITGVKGEHYPCKPDIFEMTYESAALDTAQQEPVNQVLLKALSALLTHSGMDEDEWSKPTFDQARAAIMLATTKTQECGMCGYVGTKTDAVGQCPRCHWDELQAQPERAPLSDDEIKEMSEHIAESIETAIRALIKEIA